MLELLNFLFLQWFGIRLAAMTPQHRLLLMAGVIPLTGWWTDYRYFVKNPQYITLVSRPINGREVICRHKTLAIREVTEICRKEFLDYDELDFIERSKRHDQVLKWFKLCQESQDRVL